MGRWSYQAGLAADCAGVRAGGDGGQDLGQMQMGLIDFSAQESHGCHESHCTWN